MASKYEAVPINDTYKPVDLGRSEEKFQDSRPSLSDSLNSTLLDEEHHNPQAIYREQPGLKWMWLVHAVLLTLSFTMFAASLYTRSSTAKYVQDFSAWCRRTQILKLTCIILSYSEKQHRQLSR